MRNVCKRRYSLLCPGLVEQMEDDGSQQGVRGVGPVIDESLAVRIYDGGNEILYIPCFMWRGEADFFERIVVRSARSSLSIYGPVCD